MTFFSGHDEWSYAALAMEDREDPRQSVLRCTAMFLCEPGSCPELGVHAYDDAAGAFNTDELPLSNQSTKMDPLQQRLAELESMSAESCLQAATDGYQIVKSYRELELQRLQDQLPKLQSRRIFWAQWEPPPELERFNLQACKQQVLEALDKEIAQFPAFIESARQQVANMGLPPTSGEDWLARRKAEIQGQIAEAEEQHARKQAGKQKANKVLLPLLRSLGFEVVEVVQG